MILLFHYGFSFFDSMTKSQRGGPRVDWQRDGMGSTSDACLLTSTSVCILTLGSAMTRIKQALLQHGPCEAASAPLLSATAELPFCQDGSLPFRARHRRRMCSCESNSKHQAAHRVREVRQVVGNGGSVRVLFAVAVARGSGRHGRVSHARPRRHSTPPLPAKVPGSRMTTLGVAGV